MKVGFVVTVHWSIKIRPKANLLIKRFLDSLFAFCYSDFNVYVVDNQSEFSLKEAIHTFYPYEKTKYIRIDNQKEKGLTGAWNVGLNAAYNEGCDILINCNDDLWFNETINAFIDFIESDNNEDSIYGPLTNGVLSSLQKSDRPIARVDRFPMVEGKCLSGFFFGLTKKHYNKFCFKKDEYFNKDNKHNGGDGKWGGQEGQWIQDASKGLIATLVGDCFIHHDKIRDWRVGKRLDEAGNL